MIKVQTQPHSSFQLRLTNDFVFKTFFTYYPDRGRRMMKDIIEMLTQIPLEVENITSAELVAPIIHGKDIRLDINAQCIPKSVVNFEMQTTPMKIENRALYYASMLLTQQENKGAHYDDLIPIIQAFFLDYPFSPKAHLPNKAIHAYRLQEVDDHDTLTNLMTLYIIELQKIIQMKHSYEELNGFERWCWFIEKYDDSISDPIVAELIRRHPIFKEASEIMKAISNDQAIRDEAFARDKRLRDIAQIRHERMQEVFAQGEEKGFANGEQSGIAKGEKLGIAKGHLDVARMMLYKHVQEDLILEYTGITAEQLQQLKLEMNSMLINESPAGYDVDAAGSMTDRE